MTNDDDGTPSQFMIQSTQQVWSTTDYLNLSESGLGTVRAKAEIRSVEGWALAKQETAVLRAKLDSDKFGYGSGDQTGGLIESSLSLEVCMTHFTDNLLTCPLSIQRLPEEGGSSPGFVLTVLLEPPCHRGRVVRRARIQ